MQRRQLNAALIGSLATLAMPRLAQANTYPARPIKVIVPYAAGGVVDVQARAVTQTMERLLGQPIVVDPRPGASGSIAAEAVARAAPDGYTLIVSASFLNSAHLFEDNLRWNNGQFTPIGRYALSPSYFVVPKSLPVKTVKEFVEYAKKSPKPLQYANGGNGTPQQISTVLFAEQAGIKLEPVMYKGAPPTVPDLINGLVAMTVMPSTVAYPQVKGDTLRALANMSATRSSQLPDVPTIAEAGFPGATVQSWYGLHAPKGTPPEVIAKLADAMRRACAMEEVKQRLISAGGEEAFMNTPEFVAFLDKDKKQWAAAAKVINK